MLLDARDAEDATQEALIRIVTRLASFRGEARFSTWALRIAIHRIVDYREQRGPRLSFEQFSDDLRNGLDADAVERPEDADDAWRPVPLNNHFEEHGALDLRAQRLCGVRWLDLPQQGWRNDPAARTIQTATRSTSGSRPKARPAPRADPTPNAFADATPGPGSL